MHYQNYYPQLNNTEQYMALELPGLIGDIYRELSTSTDPAIVLASLVSFVSLLTQGLADVSWPNGGTAPVGTSAGCIARSGAGKSVVFDQLNRVISKKLSKLEAINNGFFPELMIEDATREAIVEHLQSWPIAGLMSAEAGLLLKLFQTASPMLAKVLNGEEIRHARVGTGRVALRGHRVTALMMIQPRTFNSYRHLFGAGSGGVGLVNRFLLFKAGASNFGSNAFKRGMSLTTHTEYEFKVGDLLDQLVQQVSQKTPLPTLMLSSEAQAALEYQFEEIQRAQMQLATDDYRIEYMQRHCERILRLAGAFHVFCYGPTGQIDLTTFLSAERVGRISLNAYAELLYTPPKISQCDLDAQNLEAALYKFAGVGQVHSFLLKDIQRMVINIGMTKSRFYKAVHRLAGSGRFFVSFYNNQEYLNIRLQPAVHNTFVLPAAFS